MGIRGRKEGGEGDPFYLRILEKFWESKGWESKAAKKGVLLEILRGYNS